MPDSDPRDTPTFTAEHRETLGLILRMEWGPESHRTAIRAALAEIDCLTRRCQVLERDIDEGAGNAERLEAEVHSLRAEVARLSTERDEMLAACMLAYRDSVNETVLDALHAVLLKAKAFPTGICRCCGANQARLDAHNAEYPQYLPWGWADESRTLCDGCLDLPDG
jgi:hypothetical protein